MKHFLITSIVLFFSHTILGQNDSCLVIDLVKRNSKITTKQKFDLNHITISRNIIYDLKLESGKEISGKVIDVKKDTILITNYFNSSVAKFNNHILDTLILQINDIKNIRLLSDRSLGLYSSISLSDYDIKFLANCSKRKFSSQFFEIYP